MSAVHKLNPSYKSKLEWLAVDQITVDPQVQRPFDRAWAQKLAADFDPDAFGYPVVVFVPDAKGGGRHLVLDGQHRIEAVKMVLGNDQYVECEVIRGMSMPQAAKIFNRRNTTRPVKTVDRFLVAVTQGDDEAVAINNIVKSLGLSVARHSGDGVISAVAALQRVYRGDKYQGTGKNALPLKRTIGTALNAWGRTGEAMNGAVLEGLGYVVLYYGDTIDFEALEKKLRQSKGGALGLLGSARGLVDALGGSIANCVAARIVMIYNTGRNKHSLDDWSRAKSAAKKRASSRKPKAEK